VGAGITLGAVEREVVDEHRAGIANRVDQADHPRIDSRPHRRARACARSACRPRAAKAWSWLRSTHASATRYQPNTNAPPNTAHT
jgi:hypothetical protein